MLCDNTYISYWISTMDDLDKPRETSEQKAKRQWGNNDLTRRFLEEKRKPAPVVKINPDIAEVITTERVKAEETTKFERKFIKDIRLMLKGHTQQNLKDYRVALKARIHRLKCEKLRRLMAQHAGQQKLPWKKPRVVQDLFANNVESI
jgi:hypothetical protein